MEQRLSVPLWRRRDWLAMHLRLIAGAGLLPLAGLVGCQAITNPSNTDSAPALKQRATDRGVFFGACSSSYKLQVNPDYAALVTSQCNALTSESELKWAIVHPQPGQFDFTGSDALIAFADAHEMLLRGHCLVWHEALPDWVAATPAGAPAAALLEQHIGTVVGRYAGRVSHWDVVNEAINPEDGLANGLRDTPWFRLLGPDYAATAFRLAAAADPHARLFYNETLLEPSLPWAAERRVATLNLLKSLLDRGVPIHGFGLQGHWYGEETHFDGPTLKAFLADVAALGLQIVVSEVDVIDSLLPADIPTRDAAVASAYGRLLDAALSEAAVIGAVTWSLSDRYSWLNIYRPRADGLPTRGGIFDSNLMPKSVTTTVGQAFDTAPKRVAAWRVARTANAASGTSQITRLS